jgi:hypothetical protein
MGLPLLCQGNSSATPVRGEFQSAQVLALCVGISFTRLQNGIKLCPSEVTIS